MITKEPSGQYGGNAERKRGIDSDSGRQSQGEQQGKGAPRRSGCKGNQASDDKDQEWQMRRTD